MVCSQREPQVGRRTKFICTTYAGEHSPSLVRARFVPYRVVRKSGWGAKVVAMSRDHALLQAFASELKARRSALKLSQEEFAYRADVNRTYIAKLELAQNQPTLCVMHRLASAIGIEVPELLQSVMIRYKLTLDSINLQKNR